MCGPVRRGGNRAPGAGATSRSQGAPLSAAASASTNARSLAERVPASGKTANRARSAAGVFAILEALESRRARAGAHAADRPRGEGYVGAGAIAGPIVELALRTLDLRDLSLLGATCQPVAPNGREPRSPERPRKRRG